MLAQRTAPADSLSLEPTVSAPALPAPTLTAPTGSARAAPSQFDTTNAHDAHLDPARLGRVALVHDWLNQLGGAENVLEEMAAIFPAAPIFTSMYDAATMPDAWRAWEVHTAFMDGLPAIYRRHQAYLPLYPLAFGNMNLGDYDLVLSNKSGFCHGVVTQNATHKARHVCYCLTPTRYLWLFDQYSEREQLSEVTSALIQPLLAVLRDWDFAAAQRVDDFIAISTVVQTRIREIYQRESVVIHPPVDTDYFTPAADPAGDYYLIVSRLIPYKRIDLAVDAFAALPDKQLVIVGDGRDFAALRARATPNVHFLGRQSRTVVRDLLRRCAAFLFPGLEDFGIAPVEAMACGRPVIAYADGGALDTVQLGVSGELFAEQSVEALIALLQNFAPARYDPATVRRHAEGFSNGSFRQRLLAYLIGE